MWQSLSAAHVLAEFTPVEQATLQGVQGATTNLEDIVANAVAAARGSIAAGGNALDPDSTLPDQVRADVIAIARWRWLTSVPDLGEAFASKARKEAHDSAQARLEAIASGKVKVEKPLTSDAAAVPTQRPTFPTRGVTAPARQFTAESQDG